MMLAKEFGEPNVDKFLSRISSKQITEWICYYKVEGDMQKQRELAEKAEANLKKPIRKRGRL